MSITGSGLGRIIPCPPSAALPQVHAAANADMTKGTVGHRFLQGCATAEPSEVLPSIPAEYREMCEDIDLSMLPFQIRDVRAEVAVAYDVATDTARILDVTDRQYGVLLPTEIPATLDVLIEGTDEIEVWDYKFGFGSDAYAPPPERNRQLRFGALALSRALGVSLARIGRVQIRDDGTIRPDTPLELDAFDLDDIADEVTRAYAAVFRAKEEIEAGRIPDVTQGDHCLYCPAKATCPAVAPLIRQTVEDPSTMADMIAVLTPETAAMAWVRVRSVEEAAKLVRAAIETYAMEHPFPLDGDLIVGPVHSPRESIAADVAVPVLTEHYGPGVGECIAEMQTTKAKIEAALGGYAKQHGLKKKHVVEEALTLLRESNAVTVKTTTTVKEHKRHAR